MMVDRLIPLLGRDRLVSGNFFSGQFAFQVSGAWPVNSSFNRSIRIIRRTWRAITESQCSLGSGGPVTYLGGSNLAITSVSSTRNRLEAGQIFNQHPSQVRHSRQIGMLPSRYSALEKLLSDAPEPVSDCSGIPAGGADPALRRDPGHHRTYSR